MIVEVDIYNEDRFLVNFPKNDPFLKSALITQESLKEYFMPADLEALDLVEPNRGDKFE